MTGVAGIVVSAVAGGLVATLASWGIVTTMSAEPDPADQVTIVQYADV